MSDERPIGLFDSGVGGLTVLDAVARRLPHERLLYLGDTARLPYGTKSKETVRRYARRAIEFLLDHGVKAVVVACNTASALALDAVVEMSPVPVVGVVTPGAEAAVAAARVREAGGEPRRPIAVLATEATVASDAYGRAIRALDPGREVLHTACPLFVPLAEEGWTENDVARAAAARYLEPVSASGARVIVLGCTHYPLLARTIAGALPAGTTLVDSAHAAADALETALPASARRAGSEAGETRILVTDASDRLRRVAGRFLGRPAADLALIDLPV
ncbi:MAG TPA: glutamate racemase [Thermoanaerobaculia bacterium]|nr:glutamate racemase [Thermoanaerobaculia bacterium]